MRTKCPTAENVKQVNCWICEAYESLDVHLYLKIDYLYTNAVHGMHDPSNSLISATLTTVMCREHFYWGGGAF